MTRTILIDGMEQDQAWSLIRYHILHGPSDCVKRFDIPKSNGKTRPISIYPLLDRVAQWCIMGPLSKACGPLLSPINHAFQKGKSCKTAFEAFPPAGEAGYVICGDIHSFFDTVSHSLVRACLWSAGIRDSQLLHTINVTLKTPYKYPKQPKVRPEQGLPQGAPISPLLANIILAYMDRYFVSLYGDQKLPRMVRYADDFVIFCTDRKQAMTVQTQMTWFIKYRLRLDLAPEKTYLVNIKQKPFEFLGLQFAVKGNEYHKCFPQKNIERYKADISNCLETNNITLLNQKSQGWKNYSEQHSTDRGQFEILQQHLVHEMVAAEQPYYYADQEDMLLLPKKMQLSHPTVQDLYIANHDNTEEIILPIK